MVECRPRMTPFEQTSSHMLPTANRNYIDSLLLQNVETQASDNAIRPWT